MDLGMNVFLRDLLDAAKDPEIQQEFRRLQADQAKKIEEDQEQAAS